MRGTSLWDYFTEKYTKLQPKHAEISFLERAWPVSGLIFWSSLNYWCVCSSFSAHTFMNVHSCFLASSSHLLLGHLAPPFQILMILDHVTVLSRLFYTLSEFLGDSSNIKKFSSNSTSKFPKCILYSTSQLFIKTLNKAGASKPKMLHHQFYDPSTKIS